MKRQFILIICVVLSVCSLNAQEYTSSHLQKAAKKLDIGEKLSKVAKSDTLLVQGQRIIIRKDTLGRVEHIGIPLFNAFIRSLQPSPIHDYLEFAALDKKFHVSENTLQLNKLTFSKGNWETLYQLGDTINCSINNLADKTYVVQWNKNGELILEVSFPVDYELLANSSRREIETRFIKDLRAFKAKASKPVQTVDSTQLKKYAIEGVFVNEGHNYVINAITSNTYYIYNNGKYRLLYDNTHKAESMSNILLAPESLPDANITVIFSMSTYREETVDISYRQLYDFCVSNGCEPYFGYEGVANDMASGTLIMHNKKSGYNHIFYIQCPVQELGKSSAKMKGRGYIYTPSSNVRTLFGTPSEEKSKSYKYIAK